jgi:ornithine carbamoyltransferase
VAVNLYGKSFLSILDLSKEEILYLLDLSHHLKKKRQSGVRGDLLAGKNVALLFEKTSTRTRCAFELGVAEEGGHPSYIDIGSSQFGKKESVEDSAKVFAGFYHAICFRGFLQQTVFDLAKHSLIPVYNALTDDEHPTQIMADLMTIQEELPEKKLSDVKIVFVGDTRNNVAYSWMYACAKLGMHFVAYGPRELHPQEKNVQLAKEIARHSGATIEVSDDSSCLENADVIYTDVWVSMGEEAKLHERVLLLKDYRVTMDMLMKTKNPKVIFMHDLPAFHDKENEYAKTAFEKYGLDVTEVSDEVFRSKHSVVFREAENRLHTIKAIIVATLNKSPMDTHSY